MLRRSSPPDDRPCLSLQKAGNNRGNDINFETEREGWRAGPASKRPLRFPPFCSAMGQTPERPAYFRRGGKGRGGNQIRANCITFRREGSRTQFDQTKAIESGGISSDRGGRIFPGISGISGLTFERTDRAGSREHPSAVNDTRHRRGLSDPAVCLQRQNQNVSCLFLTVLIEVASEQDYG